LDCKEAGRITSALLAVSPLIRVVRIISADGETIGVAKREGVEIIPSEEAWQEINSLRSIAVGGIAKKVGEPAGELELIYFRYRRVNWILQECVPHWISVSFDRDPKELETVLRIGDRFRELLEELRK